MKIYDVIVIGGGQSGLAAGYYLRRTGLDYLILDREENPGGAWQHTWRSLRLFSPAQWSSLPGTVMPGGADYYPTRDETITYLQAYEQKYRLKIRRPVAVMHVSQQENLFVLDTTDGMYYCKALVSATGTSGNPYVPDYPGIEYFKGSVMHSSQYRDPAAFTSQSVAIVGEGNSGAQILAEVSKVADTLWITQKPPRFLADHIDGRYLFDVATQMYKARQEGRSFMPPSLGDIVMVPPVKEARERGVLQSLPPFHAFTPHGLLWEDGHEAQVDAVIFCTGFRPDVAHLTGLGIISQDNKIATNDSRSKEVPGLWLLGYGNWTGFASATLIGVGRTARQTVEEIMASLHQKN